MTVTETGIPVRDANAAASERRLARAATASGLATAGLALLVLVGWYVRIALLARGGPAYIGLHYNTAVALLLAAVALLGVVHGHRHAARVLGGAVVLIGGLTLVEHTTGWSAGLDALLQQLGMDPTTVLVIADVRSSAPGRMAPSSAVSLLLFGIALLALSRERITHRHVFIAAVAALDAMTLGAVVFSGYLIGVPAAYGWGLLTRTAVTSAAVMGVLGVGMLCASALAARRAGLDTRPLVPGLGGTAVAIATFMMWVALVDHDRNNVQQSIVREGESMTRAVGRGFEQRARVVERLAERWSRDGAPTTAEWEFAGSQALRSQAGMTWLAWIDTASVVQRLTATDRAAYAMLGRRLDADPRRAAAIADAGRGTEARASAPVTLPGNTVATTLVAPVRDAGGVLLGHIASDVVLAPLVREVLTEELDRGYGYTLRDGPFVLAAQHYRGEADSARWKALVPVSARGRRWLLHVVPTQDMLDETSSVVPTIFLLVGLAAAFLASWIVRTAQTSRARALELASTVTGLSREIEARRQAELIRDAHAAELRGQSEQFARQNDELQASAAQLATQRDALVRAQEFRSALVRSTVEAVLAFDGDRVVNAWNPAMAALTGRSVGEVEGKRYGRLLSFLSPADESQLLTDALSGRASERRDLRATHALSRRDVWLDLTVTPIRNSSLQVVGGLLTVRDVTERKRVADLIVASKEAAERSNRTKSDFLARMSHELRTPLNAVIGFTNVLRRRVADRLEPDEVGYLDRINANGRHLLSLINEVLDLSKIEAGRETVTMVDTPISVLVRDTVDELEIRATENGVALGVTAPVSATAFTDPAKLKQVLINLVGNAIKFTPRGGSVHVRVEARGEVADRIEVQDTGIGIPPGRLHAIFDAFEQADAETSRTYGGTGLGLSISQRLCALMGHELTVRSEEGAGSTFTVDLHAPPAPPSSRT